VLYGVLRCVSSERGWVGSVRGGVVRRGESRREQERAGESRREQERAGESRREEERMGCWVCPCLDCGWLAQVQIFRYRHLCSFLGVQPCAAVHVLDIGIEAQRRRIVQVQRRGEGIVQLQQLHCVSLGVG
jgi:hypothetical protein